MKVREATWLATTPLRLATGVERVEGVDGQALLYDSRRGAYVRLGNAGATVIGLLDGTRTAEQICESLAARAPGNGEQVRRAMVRFLCDLRQAGVLNVPPEALSPGRRLFQQGFLVKFPVLRHTQSLTRILGKGLQAVSRSATRAMLAVALAGAASVVAYVLTRRGVPTPGLTHWPVILSLILVHLGVHELAHMAVCGYYGVTVREIGVGLLFGFIPVAYVDHTDSYRLQSRRQHVAIALAGPTIDLTGAGCSALVSLLAGLNAAATARALMTWQVALLMANLNPLLPGDGYHALAGALGELNLRGRAFAHVFARIRRKSDSNGLDVHGIRAVIYVAYALLFASGWGALLTIFLARVLAGGR